MHGCGTCSNRLSPTRFASTLASSVVSGNPASVIGSGYGLTAGHTRPTVTNPSMIRRLVVEIRAPEDGPADVVGAQDRQKVKVPRKVGVVVLFFCIETSNANISASTELILMKFCTMEDPYGCS